MNDNIFETSCYYWEPITVEPVKGFVPECEPNTRCNVVFRGIHTEVEAISQIVPSGNLFQYLPEISDYYIVMEGKLLAQILEEHPMVKAIILCRLKSASSWGNSTWSSCCCFSPLWCKGISQVTWLDDSWCRYNDEFWYEGNWHNSYEWFTAIDPIESAKFKVDGYECGTNLIEYECAYLKEFEKMDYLRENGGVLYKAFPKERCVIINGALRKYFCETEEQTIALPEGIDKIWEKALIDCKNAAIITLPPSVKTISEGTLSWADNLKILVCNIPVEKIAKNMRTAAIIGFCQATKDGNYTFSEKTIQKNEQYIANNLESLFREKTDHNIILTYISAHMVIAQSSIDGVILRMQAKKKPPKILPDLIDFARVNAEKINAMPQLSSEQLKKGNPIAGKTIVVTGELKNFPEKGKYPERKKFRALVEKHGGKLGSSITKSTAFLVCNDVGSTTVKAKQARENNIPIVSEKEFLSMINSIKG